MFLVGCSSPTLISVFRIPLYSWTAGLTITSTIEHAKHNEDTLKVALQSVCCHCALFRFSYLFSFLLSVQLLLQSMLDLAKQYNKRLQESEEKSAEELAIANVHYDICHVLMYHCYVSRPQ